MLRKHRAKEKLVRFQVEIKQELLSEMDELQQQGGLSSKKELLNNALTLLRWAMTQRQQGYIISSVGADGDVKELQMPVLENAAIISPRISKISYAASVATHEKQSGDKLSSFGTSLIDDAEKDNSHLITKPEDETKVSSPRALAASRSK